MKVFVTGVNGYIGAVLGPHSGAGPDVRGLDTGYYTDGWLYNGDRTADARAPSTRTCATSRREDLEGCDADRPHGRAVQRPAGRSSTRTSPTRSTTRARSALAELATRGRRRALRLHVLVQRLRRRRPATSSTRPRRSTRRPPTPTARRSSSATSASWRPTISRRRSCATRPPSARRRGMRFDIVLNNLAGLAWTTKRSR